MQTSQPLSVHFIPFRNTILVLISPPTASLCPAFLACEMVAENGRFGGCFRHPFHQSLTRAPGRFNHFLGFSHQAFELFTARFRHLFFPPPHFLRGAYFSSSSSLPNMGFSPIYLRVLARSIYGIVFPTGLRPCLPRRPPS